MNLENMIFQDWQGIVRTMIVGVLAYASLVMFLRISGKRTLAKLNAFDLVVTVALGSTLSAVLLQESIALAEGAVALALLILMQYLVTFLSVRSQGFARLIRSEPALLAHKGEYCAATMKRQRITQEEVDSAIRAGGAASIKEVEGVVLESDGTLSILTSAAPRNLPGKDGSTRGTSRDAPSA
ncbi:DUF421 domain-containing protein [Nitratireductor basaltis]|uniref:Membrane protein n=1 Tax=Nitratireductor basaltis TaxID=472175 RepID=A0A084UDR2_9HYPH|nr:YetF domain-containing protein [Nitratireductor basaltis]KFB11098.1 Membrane protein [Nitratireductor basaltis]